VRFAEHGILVFEFVETWNKKDKANIDGFFLQPNVIVLKRQQSAFRREIFTLVHELGHYLLVEEEVESLEIDKLAQKDATATEKWCNDFAYYFLIGNLDDKIEETHSADSTNDYCHDLIEEISSKTHLSKLALFTRLLYQGKISRTNYTLVRKEFEAQHAKRREEEKKQKEIDKALGVESRGRAPKPINSPLLISTLQTAFYEGVISEYDVGKALNIKPEQVESFLQ
jgi:Zn-dependent peptidase ImmA (M78 family)